MKGLSPSPKGAEYTTLSPKKEMATLMSVYYECQATRETQKNRDKRCVKLNTLVCPRFSPLDCEQAAIARNTARLLVDLESIHRKKKGVIFLGWPCSIEEVHPQRSATEHTNVPLT